MIKKILGKIKNLMLSFKGNHLTIKKTIVKDYDWYGNGYGGFYVCPELINDKSIVYSFGIGEDISFDEKLIQTKKLKCR